MDFAGAISASGRFLLLVGQARRRERRMDGKQSPIDIRWFFAVAKKPHGVHF
jgi:hypothetical protein